MPVRRGVLIAMLAIICGCRSRNLEVEVTNNTPDRVDVIALVPYQITGLFSERESLLELHSKAECYALTLEPGQAWSSEIAGTTHRVHRDVDGGAGVGWPFLMLRRTPQDAAGPWQDIWINSTTLEPMEIRIDPAGSGLGVRAFDHEGEALDARPLDPVYARQWLSPHHDVPNSKLDVVRILDARERGLPLDLEPR